jgi:transposase
MAIVMGVDRHRAQITAEWVDAETGEVSRAWVAPADREGVRGLLVRFGGHGLEVSLEATTGWRFVVEELRRDGASAPGRAGADQGAEGSQEAPEDRSSGRPPPRTPT